MLFASGQGVRVGPGGSARGREKGPAVPDGQTTPAAGAFHGNDSARREAR